MLFDEPTSSLVLELGLEVLASCGAFAERDDHDRRHHEMPLWPKAYRDRVVVMADGRSSEEGRSAEVMRGPTTSGPGQRFCARDGSMTTTHHNDDRVRRALDAGVDARFLVIGVASVQCFAPMRNVSVGNSQWPLPRS